MGEKSCCQDSIKIVAFSNQTKEDKRLLKQFVDFHWKHYADDPLYVPLLDYEYMGFKLLGIQGFFEPENLFFKHAEMCFFMALKNDLVVGRCNAFINTHHNKHWNDKVGFFGQFEAIDDQDVTHALIEAATNWLKEKGMDRIRGPQNLPVNEATPGFMIEGFDSRPVMYYHYNKPYYAGLVEKEGFEVIQRVCSWEAEVQKPFDDPRFDEIANKVIDRYNLKAETWDQRSLDVRKQEMFDIYNAAWNDNFGFVPFTEEEFFLIVDDMMLILDRGLFIFLYKGDEPVAFFGGIPNVGEKMNRIGKCRNCELLRAIRMLLSKGQVKGFRVGYLGVKPAYRRLGLDAVMLLKQHEYAKKRGYEYADMGWVLEDNTMIVRMIERVGAKPSKTYSIYEKPIS
ncbi:hypothetical protein HQ585_05960 [candidate division KSB1 bacterium]|nr:hypothetical protein [candidate division KSB1 bacterium]